MSITKKAISVGLSAALLASLAATVVAPAAFAATITGITYSPSGSAVGATVGAGTLATFTPPTALAGGTIVTLTLPAGTTFTGSLVATDLTFEQAGGVATSPSNISVSGTVITATLAAGSVGTAGNQVTVAVTAGGAGKITNPTAVTTSGVFAVATGAGDSGSINTVSFVAGPATKYVVTAASATPAPGTTDLITAQLADEYGNPVTSGSENVTWVLGGAGSIAPTTGTTTNGSASTTLTAGAAGQQSTVTVIGATTAFTGSVVVTATTPSGTPPATPGTITVSKTVSVPRGGSAVTLGTYTFQEGSVGDWSTGQSVSVCFYDANDAGSTLTLAGGTAAGSGALGTLTLTVSNNCFTVSIGASSAQYLESFTVSGLTMTASSSAAPGTISAQYTTNFDSNSVYFGGSTGTASGSLAASYLSGTTAIAVNMSAGSPAFQAGTATIGTETVHIQSVVSNATGYYCNGVVLTSGQECLFLAAGTASSHSFNEAVTETIAAANGTAPSPGSVSDALALSVYPSTAAIPQLRVGVTNQTPDEVSLSEQTGSNGLLAAGTVITLTTPAGVLFSNAPVLDVVPSSLCGPTTNYPAFSLVSNIATLSTSRSSATFTVAKGDSPENSSCVTTLVFSMQYDVAASGVAGTAINLTVTAGTIPVVPASVENASLGAAVFVTSTTPTIFINQNDQALGSVSITENAAGALSAAANTDTFFVCLTQGEYFTRPPWAVVTNGDLTLAPVSGGVPSLVGPGVTKAPGVEVYPGASISGSINQPPNYGSQTCYGWAVYSASTKASTIAIEGVDASGNPTATAHVNVPGWMSPGPTYLSIGTMPTWSATQGNLIDIATVAIRAFQSGVSVTALGQPYIAPGTTAPAKFSVPAAGTPGNAGNIQIAETGPNLLVGGETIYCSIQPRTNQPTIQDTFLNSANQNQQPIVSTNGGTTGLQAHLGWMWATGFAVVVDQAASAGLGVITVSNINYNVTADAVTGPVFVECSNYSSGTATPTGTISSAPESSATYIPGTQCLYVTPTNQFGFYPGESVDLNPGGANDETVVLGSSCGSPLLPQEAFIVTLTKTHHSGEQVTAPVYTGAIGSQFSADVSNAVVGTAPVAQKVVMSADSSLTASGPFTTATKLLKPGQSITIRVRTNPQLAGTRLGVWIAIKGANGTWGPYKPHTSVTTDVNGTAYYTYTFGSKAWLAFRFYYGGDATHAPAWSYPSQFGRAM